MATKWRGRLRMAAWAFLLVFGLSGILAVFNYGSSYVSRDYFHTPEFLSELDQFTQYLSMFEINTISLEEAKKTIKVTDDDILQYRNQYAELTTQIIDISNEYSYKIDEALAIDNQALADIYTAERDTKIEKVTNVFKNDEFVIEQVRQEKEQRMEQYFNEMEYNRPEYLRYKETFFYYLENKAANLIYTNLRDAEGNPDPAPYMNSPDLLFITSYSMPQQYSIRYSIPEYNSTVDLSIPFEGQIAVSPSLPASNAVMIESKRYQTERILLLIYGLASISALLACFYMMRKASVIPAGMEKWGRYYAKLPIDVRGVVIALTGVGVTVGIFSITDQMLYGFRNPLVYGWNIGSNWIIATLLMCLTLVQWKWLAPELQNWQSFRERWEQALLSRAVQYVKRLSRRATNALQNAFLIRSMGTQLFLLLTIVFGLGLGASMIVADPEFILVYLILILVIGAPVVIMLIKRIGYFNRIVTTTNELAVGSLGQDLPVLGKSVLALTAGNINVLKHGVKMLQNENAKSERLKTELITNVSHDLRTPLTSIITYTELLKKEELSSEDRMAYLEILDRKSKRLKVLIDDLFEVSKMASGNMELILERVDLVQLLQQALAEYDNQIHKSSLQFRVTYAETAVYALVDGKKLWRVFDNLIGNIINYSLEHTRVYIAVQALDGQAVITFKNVSKYELSGNSDELYERFKRGDTSRHTEGSGLGLAIAKSIVDLHDGKLIIETDGDLFKASISLKITGME